jgi:hypothetical protein
MSKPVKFDASGILDYIMADDDAAVAVAADVGAEDAVGKKKAKRARPDEDNKESSVGKFTASRTSDGIPECNVSVEKLVNGGDDVQALETFLDDAAKKDGCARIVMPLGKLLANMLNLASVNNFDSKKDVGGVLEFSAYFDAAAGAIVFESGIPPSLSSGNCNALMCVTVYLVITTLDEEGESQQLLLLPVDSASGKVSVIRAPVNIGVTSRQAAFVALSEQVGWLFPSLAPVVKEYNLTEMGCTTIHSSDRHVINHVYGFAIDGTTLKHPVLQSMLADATRLCNSETRLPVITVATYVNRKQHVRAIEQKKKKAGEAIPADEDEEYDDATTTGLHLLNLTHAPDYFKARNKKEGVRPEPKDKSGDSDEDAEEEGEEVEDDKDEDSMSDDEESKVESGDLYHDGKLYVCPDEVRLDSATLACVKFLRDDIDFDVELGSTCTKHLRRDDRLITLFRQ